MDRLLFWRAVLFAGVCLSFPCAAFAVFYLGWNRELVADGLSIGYGCGIALAISTAYWPLPAPAAGKWSPKARLESLVLTFLGMSYVTHLTWELGWLCLYPRIAVSRDAAWAYTWWAYIDGGDARYGKAMPSSTLLGIEMLSVANGTVGAFAMMRFLRSSRRSRAAVLVLTGTAVVHLYSAALYYMTELLDGLPNVNTVMSTLPIEESFIGLYIKFGLANAPWVVCPWFVFRWCYVTLCNGIAGTNEIKLQ